MQRKNNRCGNNGNWRNSRRHRKLPFLEAIRQVAIEQGKENVMFIHVTLVPHLGKTGELKTKPTQHSVKELRSIGIQPDMIVCRTELSLTQDLKEKIALFAM